MLFDRKLMNALVLTAGLPVLAACSGDGFGSVNLIPANSLRPDWLSYSGHKEEFALRPAGAHDLVGPDGQCAAQTNSGEPTGEAQALAQSGIALQMTECDVVRRAGAPDSVELGTSQGGERLAVLTYSRGLRPGIYRFTSGRLISIERGPEPAAPARPQKAQTKKRA